MPAGRLEIDLDLAPYLVVDTGGEPHAAGLAQGLDARGDVHAVAVDVAAVDHDVAEVDADAVAHALRLRAVRLMGGELLLHLDGALHPLDDARELRDQGVAPGVHHAAVVALDERRHGGARSAQVGERAGFVRAHQA